MKFLKSRWEEREMMRKKKMAATLLAAALLGSAGTVEASWLSGVMSKIDQKLDEYESGQKVVRGEFRFSEWHKDKPNYPTRHEGIATATKADIEELVAVYSFSLSDASRISWNLSSHNESLADGIKVLYAVCDRNGNKIVGPVEYFLKGYSCTLPAGNYSLRVYIKAPAVGKSAEYSASGYCEAIPVNAPQKINTITTAFPISLGDEVVNCWYESERSRAKERKNLYQYYKFHLTQGTNVEFKMNTLAYLSCKLYLLDEGQNVLASVWDPFDDRKQSRTSLYLAPGTYYVKAGDYSWMPYKFSITSI